METPLDARPPDFDEYTIATPENVTFGYQVAGIGSRFIGALIDTTLIVLLLIMLNILLGVALGSLAGDTSAIGDFSEDPGWIAGLVLAIYALLNFAIFWGYYMVFELGWHGQTPGKRIAGTRVVKMDGSGPSFLEVAIRNLVRIVDFLPAAYALGFVTMFLNRNARRLGDFAAGTLVVRQSQTTTLESLFGSAPARPQPSQAASPPGEIPHHTRSDGAPPDAPPPFPNLRRLTGDDYQLICTVLDRQMRGRADPSLTIRLAGAIATKLETPPPGPTFREAQRFLYAVADAYRRGATLS